MTARTAPSASLFTRLAGALAIALTGRETRYVGRLYIGRIFLFAALVLAVILSLDAANNIGGVLGAADQAGTPSGLGRLSYYLLLRAGYNLPAILPLAALIGVIWAEFALANSRQRMMISNSGRPVLLSLAPAILIGLMVGLVQFTALATIRPAAVELQALEGFRDYGPKFGHGETGRKWLSVEGAVIETRIAFADPVELRDAVIYELASDGALRSIRTAQSATPNGEDSWTFRNGTMWQVPGFDAPTAPEPATKGAVPFAAEVLALDLDPLWVENVDIMPSFLPQVILSRLGSAETGIQNIATYKAALHERFAAVFYVMGMAVLPAALGIVWFLPGMGARPLIKVVIWGMGAYFTTSILSMLGSYGYLPPLVAAWSAPAIFLIVALGMVIARTPQAADD